MAQGPITRFENNTGKVLATILLLAISSLPSVVCAYALGRSELPDKTLVIASLTAVCVMAGIGLYWAVHKWAPSHVYSGDEIEAWFQATRLFKVMKIMGLMLSYWRLATGLFIIVLTLYVLIFGL